MKHASLVLALTALVFGDQDGLESRVVTIDQGAVRGYKETENNFYGFYGIPYATAPTGPHKFKAPLPPPTWQDTFEATNKDIMCPQTSVIYGIVGYERNITKTEDCLIANIFVPDTTEDSLPVVIYVHGGAFQLGFGNMLYHEPLLKSGKIIEVTFNYRLGAHGFLCLGTEDVPGNAGMKDQVAALRWVKQNIGKFGGNADDVTIAGFSAGSASVDLLMLSGSARGLFNKVIPESGVAIGVSAVQVDPLSVAKEYAKTQGFKNFDDVYALEEFYKTSSLDLLQADPFMDRGDSTFVFVPCVERTKDEQSFLTEAPYDILKRGSYDRVPILIGFSNMEGMFRLPLFEEWKDMMNKNFADFLPADLQFANEKERKVVSKKVKKYYFGDKDIDTSTILGFVNYFSDVMFTYSTMRSVRFYTKAGGESVYLYHYSYVDKSHPLPYNVYGADHCAQSITISDSIYIDAAGKVVSEEYGNVKKMMADIWVNFITTGKPLVKESQLFSSGWPAFSFEDQYYMELNLKPDLRKDLLKKRMDFWDGIYARYYRTPVAPPAPPPRKTEL